MVYVIKDDKRQEINRPVNFDWPVMRQSRDNRGGYDTFLGLKLVRVDKNEFQQKQCGNNDHAGFQLFQMS